MKVKVSVIIPAYNQATFIPKAVASLQAQTLDSWECIVVDDGSTDNTAEIVTNIALREPRVRLLQKQNGGSASARDMGLKHAQGEFIQFLDADDTIASNKLEQQVLGSLGFRCVCTHSQFFIPHGFYSAQCIDIPKCMPFP